MQVGHIYLISEGPEGPIKIGRSVSPASRLTTLQTGNPRALHICAEYCLHNDQVSAAEQCLHEELECFALVGEWFDLSEEFMSRYMPDFFLSNGFEPLR